MNLPLIAAKPVSTRQSKEPAPSKPSLRRGRKPESTNPDSIGMVGRHAATVAVMGPPMRVIQVG